MGIKYFLSNLQRPSKSYFKNLAGFCKLSKTYFISNDIRNEIPLFNCFVYLFRDKFSFFLKTALVVKQNIQTFRLSSEKLN